MLRLCLALCLIAGSAAANTSLPAVVEVGPAAICTSDINICGHSSVCGCDEGYSYSGSVGLCLIDDVFAATAPGITVEVQACARQPDGICTRDINPAGHPSMCTCDDGETYSPVTGLCMTAPG